MTFPMHPKILFTVLDAQHVLVPKVLRSALFLHKTKKGGVQSFAFLTLMLLMKVHLVVVVGRIAIVAVGVMIALLKNVAQGEISKVVDAVVAATVKDLSAKNMT